MKYQAKHLRCEYLNDPLAVASLTPRLSWKGYCERQGAAQSAYRILVSSSPENLKMLKGDIWDSEKVNGSKSVQITYEGKALESYQQVFWKIMVWDEKGREGSWSKPASWTMGLLEAKDWKASWIGNYLGASKTSPLLRKEFKTHKKIKRALLHASALGLYHIQVNGRNIGDDLFAPGWTDYSKRRYYRGYDVTKLLKSGRHCIGAEIAYGWYKGTMGWEGHTYGNHTAILVQLRIEYMDGSVETISSDTSWKSSFGRDGLITWGGIQSETKEALETLHRWYKAGYIHPDFITDRWYKEVNDKFFSGKVGYNNYFTSSESFDPLNPASAIHQLKALNSKGDAVPAVIPSGPRGERGHRVWGTGGGGMVFGYTVAEDPIKLIRFLKITEALSRDENLFIEASIGTKGVHWEWQGEGPGSGAVNIPPFDDATKLQNEGLVPPRFVEKLNLFPAYLDDERQRKYWPPNKANIIDRFTPQEWGVQDVLGRDDAVSALAPTLSRLKAKQMTRFAEFIVGGRDLSEWDTWVQTFLEEGGREAIEQYRVFYGEAMSLAKEMEQK